MIGNQDPYVRLELDSLESLDGLKWVGETPFRDDAGNHAIWNEIQTIACILTDEELANKKLIVSVYDKNDILQDAFMGCGDISLLELSQLPNTSQLLTVNLKDENLKSAGTVEILASVLPILDPAGQNDTIVSAITSITSKSEANASIVLRKSGPAGAFQGDILEADADTVIGLSQELDFQNTVKEPRWSEQVRVAMISVSECRSMHTLGKNCPLVKLTCGDFEGETKAMISAGPAASWRNLPWDSWRIKKRGHCATINIEVWSKRYLIGTAVLPSELPLEAPRDENHRYVINVFYVFYVFYVLVGGY